jgi:anti-anti-sigma regulatory factor
LHWYSVSGASPNQTIGAAGFCPQSFCAMDNLQSRRLVVTLSGAYDVSRRDELRSVLSPTEAFSHLTIDVHDVSSADYTLVSELGLVRKRHPRARIQLVGASADLRNALRLVGFDEVMQIDG